MSDNMYEVSFMRYSRRFRGVLGVSTTYTREEYDRSVPIRMKRVEDSCFRRLEFCKGRSCVFRV